MKKLMSTILVFAFILAALSALAPSISAKSATISESEARELVVQASDFFYDTRVEGYNEDFVDRKSEDRRKVHYPEYDLNVTYLPVYETKLPGGSYSAMCELAKTIYAGDAASDSYSLGMYYIFDGNDQNVIKYPNFYIDDRGNVFANHFLEYGYISVREDTVNLVSNIRGDSSEASAIIAIRSYWADGPRPYYHYPVECKFVNTDDGWRIAESEFSILFATNKDYLDAYREANPEKVNPDALKFTAAEAKYLVDLTVTDCLIDYYVGYYERYLEYVQRKKLEVNEIVKEVTNPDGSKSAVKYVEDIEYIGTDGYAGIFLTEEASESFMKKVYYNNDFDNFITEGNTQYMAYLDGADDLSFVYDPNEVVVEVIESTDKEATARVYCGLKRDGKVIPIYIECKFEKEYSRWYIAESDFVDMLTSADGFEYTVGEAPATGDRAFDTLTLCLGGMAIVMSALCIVRRRREF
ncbi:MAG: hypothetical protein IIX44_01985 [Clostridia bacterium]|nr:hypothetical protein [Clostridia bacterium]